MRSYLVPVLLWLGSALAVPLEQREFPDLRAVLTTGRRAPWSPDTIISFPGSEEFDNATARWTIAGAPTYAAAITPATEADVSQAVRNPTNKEEPTDLCVRDEILTHSHRSSSPQLSTYPSWRQANVMASLIRGKSSRTGWPLT